MNKNYSGSGAHWTIKIIYKLFFLSYWHSITVIIQERKQNGAWSSKSVEPLWLCICIVTWEPEGRYPAYSNTCIYRWEPEGRYRHRHCTAIAPSLFSTEHLWILKAPFWLPTDDICSNKLLIRLIYAKMRGHVIYQHEYAYPYTSIFCKHRCALVTERQVALFTFDQAHNYIFIDFAEIWKYTERQKKLITSSGRRPLKSTVSTLIIFAHKISFNSP